MSAGYDVNFVRDVAHAEAARRSTGSTACYLQRGRTYRDLPNGDLADVWTALIHAWASAQSERPSVLDDLEAEFILRGVGPPYALVRDDIGRLAARAMALVAGMPEEDRRAEAERMVYRHLDERARCN